MDEKYKKQKREFLKIEGKKKTIKLFGMSYIAKNDKIVEIFF